MRNKKTILFSPFRYVVPADYEVWFENLALEGWHPQKIGQWSSFAMNFIKGEPQKYRYVVDVQAMPKKDYRQTYEDFDWEFVGQMASVFVWRKQYTDERPESFSDVGNLMERNKRFIWAISFSFIMSLLAAIVVSVCFVINYKSLVIDEYIQFAVGLILSYGLAISLGCIMRKIKKNIER